MVGAELGRAPEVQDEAKEAHKRKLEHILRDREAALAANERLYGRIGTNKGWSITVALAYLGFMATFYGNPSRMPWLVLVPLAVAEFLFWIMEGYYRSQSLFLREVVLGPIDKMFDEKSEADFRKDVRGYIFKSIRARKKTFKENRGRLWEGCCAIEALLWYSLLLFLVLIWGLLCWLHGRQ